MVPQSWNPLRYLSKMPLCPSSSVLGAQVHRQITRSAWIPQLPIGSEHTTLPGVWGPEGPRKVFSSGRLGVGTWTTEKGTSTKGHENSFLYLVESKSTRTQDGEQNPRNVNYFKLFWTFPSIRRDNNDRRGLPSHEEDMSVHCVTYKRQRGWSSAGMNWMSSLERSLNRHTL